MAVVQNHPTFSFSPEGQPWVSPFVLGGKHACLGIYRNGKSETWEPSVRFLVQIRITCLCGCS